MLLSEWFESDLLVVGIIIMIIAALLPMNREKLRVNWLIIAICFVIYAICELLEVTIVNSYMMEFIFLFISGIAFAVAVGRLIRLCIVKLIKPKNK